MGSNGIPPDMDNLRQLLDEDVRAHQTGTFPPSSFAEMLAEVHEEAGAEADTLHGRLNGHNGRCELVAEFAASLRRGAAGGAKVHRCKRRRLAGHVVDAGRCSGGRQFGFEGGNPLAQGTNFFDVGHGDRCWQAAHRRLCSQVTL